MNVDRTFPQPKAPKPRTPAWAWCVITFLAVLTLILIPAAIRGGKVAAASQPVKTVTVTKTVTDTSATDGLQSQFDSCKAAFHQLAGDSAKFSDLFQQTTSIAAEAVQAAAISDSATLDSDTSQINDVTSQVQSLTADVGTIDGGSCQ